MQCTANDKRLLSIALTVSLFLFYAHKSKNMQHIRSLAHKHIKICNKQTFAHSLCIEYIETCNTQTFTRSLYFEYREICNKQTFTRSSVYWICKTQTFTRSLCIEYVRVLCICTFTVYCTYIHAYCTVQYCTFIYAHNKRSEWQSDRQQYNKALKKKNVRTLHLLRH